MKIYLFSLFLLFCAPFFKSQTSVSGIVLNENQIPLPAVLVVNINSDAKTYTNQNGQFEINATAGNELRFIRQNYDRLALKINSWDFSFPLNVTMIYMPTEIEEVEIGFQPSGDLAKDSKKLQKADQLAILNREIGLPKNPEKPRETPPPTLKQAGILRYVASNINIFNLYKNISGDARRMRNLYKYEDFQEKISWLKSNLKPDFFKENQIPDDQVSDFLSFVLLESAELRFAVKTKNNDKAEFVLIEFLPKYLKRVP